MLRHFDLRPQSDGRCGPAPGLYRHWRKTTTAPQVAQDCEHGEAKKRQSQREHSRLACGRDLQQSEREAAYLRERDDRDRHGQRARRLRLATRTTPESRCGAQPASAGRRIVPRLSGADLNAAANPRDSDRPGHRIRPAAKNFYERQASPTGKRSDVGGRAATRTAGCSVWIPRTGRTIWKPT